MYPPVEPQQAVVPEIAPQENTEFSPDMEANAFKDLLQSAREEDRTVREDYVRLWKRLEYYWNNILDIFLDPVTKDWRIPNWDELEEVGEIAPRLINIYRPHGEAIVAALSVTIPTLYFHPDDADSPDDMETAQAYRNITDLLALHNEAPMLFIKIIVILFNQGTVFGYNYYHTNPKYGSYSKPKVEYQDIAIFEAFCPQCGAGLDGGVLPPQNPAQQNPQIPQNPMVGPQPQYQCQSCGYQGPAQINQDIEKLPQIVGFDNTPKGTICQELFSGLHVKVPAYVRKQEECGYLLLEFAQAVPMLRSIFKDKADKINGRKDISDYESFVKIPLQYLGQYPDNAANVSCIWLRPWQFWELGAGRVGLIEHLGSKYPDGCYAIFINDEFMEVFPENMDEHWTISKNPLGHYIYSRPLGENLATIQDIRAQLVEIELQTAEYGIPETFADGKVLDFKKYGEGRAKPGMMTQVMPRAGKSIGDAFFTTKSAVLSQEIDPLRQHIDQDAQFVVGSFPSVYGGPATGGSKTASEYAQSKAQALQRLGTFWKIAVAFWSQFQSRSATEYANILKEMGKDERFTKREGQNSYINVWIRNSSLSGKIGRIEPEATEQLPSSWAQKKDAIQQLLMTGIPEIMSVLLDPNNAELMKEAVGLNELYIPGEEDRTRQYKEFSIMSQGIPVPVNQILDNHQVHSEVLKGILQGINGDSLDEQIKMICMQHLMEHEQFVAQQQMQAEQQSGAQPPAKQKEKSNVSSGQTGN